MNRTYERLLKYGTETTKNKCNPNSYNTRERGISIKLTKPMTVYKKARLSCNTIKRVIIKLEIPVGARVICSDVTGSRGKMRCNVAIVRSINGIKCTQSHKSAVAIYDNSFVYKVGTSVKPSTFNKHMEQCGGGIHFYLTRRGAEEH